MDLFLPPLPASLSLLDFTESDNVPLIRKRTCHSPAVVLSSSSHNCENNNRIVIEQVSSKLRSNVVDFIKDDNDRMRPNIVNLVEDDDKDKIPIKDILTRFFVPTPLPFCRPRLKLRNKDLEEEEFRVRDNNQNP